MGEETPKYYSEIRAWFVDDPLNDHIIDTIEESDDMEYLIRSATDWIIKKIPEFKNDSEMLNKIKVNIFDNYHPKHDTWCVFSQTTYFAKRTYTRINE